MDNHQKDMSLSLKIKLIEHIKSDIKKNGWTQTYAAKKMSISRSRFCRIMGGQINDVSEWRLIQCLIDLGNDIQITITKPKENNGNIRVD